MLPDSNGQQGAPAKLCHRWATGECRFGDKCLHAHPENLSPDLQPETNYKVSNTPGKACPRCLDRHLPCDKADRKADNDPCEECRHFGGESAKCAISLNTSYNDQMWKQMINNTLSKFKPRDEPGKKVQKLGDGTKDRAKPMRDDLVAANWKGRTRNELLALGDPLPPDVRNRPPPGVTHQQAKSRVWKSLQLEKEESAPKRKREDISEHIQPAAQQYGLPRYEVPQIPMPPPDAQRGNPKSLLLEYGSDGSVTSATISYPSISGDGGVDVTLRPAPAGLPALPVRDTSSKSFGGSYADDTRPSNKKRRITAHLNTAQQSRTQAQLATSTELVEDDRTPPAASGDASLESQAADAHTGEEDNVKGPAVVRRTRMRAEDLWGWRSRVDRLSP